MIEHFALGACTTGRYVMSQDCFEVPINTKRNPIELCNKCMLKPIYNHFRYHYCQCTVYPIVKTAVSPQPFRANQNEKQQYVKSFNYVSASYLEYYKELKVSFCCIIYDPRLHLPFSGWNRLNTLDFNSIKLLLISNVSSALSFVFIATFSDTIRLKVSAPCKIA